MYIYLKYKYDKKIEMVQIILNRTNYMRIACISSSMREQSIEELMKNNDRIIKEFGNYNKSDLLNLLNLLQNDVNIFSEIVKSQTADKIQLWKENATQIAIKLNEMDERKWSRAAGEKLLHEFQDLATHVCKNGDVFNSMQDMAVKIALFIS